MIDPRVTKLAELLCNFSTKLTSLDKVLITAIDTPENIVAEFIRVAQSTGAQVFVRCQNQHIQRQILLGFKEEAIQTQHDIALKEASSMTANIILDCAANIFELSDISAEKMRPWQKAMKPARTYRIKKTKWVVVGWPHPGFAQNASMSTQEFENFYFNACLIDYKKMEKATQPLRELMEKTDQVHIIGPGTDLRFSIKDIPSVPCVGGFNVPDGECFSAPVKDSMEGTIQYNVDTPYHGSVFSNVRFVVKNGKIIEASADQNVKKLNEILDTDSGARYFGEWSMGYHPRILHPMKDILFDEKIAGSFHLTPGQAYEEANNGNESAIHWDIVCIQRPEYGGGEIWFDGKLIRKDGIFVLPELEGLNPDQLV